MGKNSAHMKNYLCGCHDMESAEVVHFSIGPEGFHHCLLAGFSVVCPVNHIVTGREDSLDIAVFGGVTGAEIASVVGTYRAWGFPVIFRMY